LQAEDDILDRAVTGVQTCALPICGARGDRDQAMRAGAGHPLTPVTSTSPRGLIAISSSTAGRFKSRIVLTSYGIDRKANATVPQIGRASGREREWTEVGEGSRKGR